MEIPPTAGETIYTEHLCQGASSWARSVAPTAGAVCRSCGRAGAGSPGRKGVMGPTVCVLHCLHPERGEGKASAAVEAAFQVAGSGVGGDVCGEEASTPKGTESKSQPFSSSHPDPLCVPSVLQVPAPPKSLLFPAGERSACSQPVESPQPPTCLASWCWA